MKNQQQIVNKLIELGIGIVEKDIKIENDQVTATLYHHIEDDNSETVFATIFDITDNIFKVTTFRERFSVEKSMRLKALKFINDFNAYDFQRIILIDDSFSCSLCSVNIFHKCNNEDIVRYAYLTSSTLLLFKEEWEKHLKSK